MNSPPSAPRLRGLRLNESARLTMFTCCLSGRVGCWAAERSRSKCVLCRVAPARHTFCMSTAECQWSPSAMPQRASVPRQADWIVVAVQSQNIFASRWS